MLTPRAGALGTLIFWLLAVPASADPTPIDPARLQLIADSGAVANLQLLPAADEQRTVAVVVVKQPGPEFWSVELRVPGLNIVKGKRYELQFRAKASPAEYIYAVLEQAGGPQAAVALGTTLRVPTDWTDCTVSFDALDDGNPGRLTISGLSVEPAQFSFSDLRLTER